MAVKDSIGQMAERIIQNETKRVSQRIILYSNGVIAKVDHSNYALSKLKELSTQSDASTTANDKTYSVSKKLHFYVDSFYAFLYSSLDVIAQVINQKLHLGIDERRVSIKSVKNTIDTQHATHPLKNILDRLFRTNAFINLEKYRNCSTHRRQIFIRALTVVIQETPGYTTTGDLTSVKRLLCDDPLALSPTVNQERELISYCENVLNRVSEEIEKIANNL